MEFFWNAFWVFIGIVAGAIIQFGFHSLIKRSQKGNAKKLLLVEIEINRKELGNLKAELTRKKDLFASIQFQEGDFGFNFASFNYRMMDPLINSGYFHIILDADGVKKYFQFVNDLNVNNSKTFEIMLREHHGDGSSVKFLNWILDTKLTEWGNSLDFIEGKLR